MRYHNFILSVATLATSVGAATELIVDVYEGPTECVDADKITNGKYVSMHYTGTIDESSETGTRGMQFDSSRIRGETFNFTIGTGQVIQGWENGLLGLCKGAKAKLIIPPDMGYGDDGAGLVIPGGATLNFDVEVVNSQDECHAQPIISVIFKQKMVWMERAHWIDQQSMPTLNRGRETPNQLIEHIDKDRDGSILCDEFSGSKGDLLKSSCNY